MRLPDAGREAWGRLGWETCPDDTDENPPHPDHEKGRMGRHRWSPEGGTGSHGVGTVMDY